MKLIYILDTVATISTILWNQVVQVLILNEVFKIKLFVYCKFIVSQTIMETTLLCRLSKQLSLIDTS